ncbi:MAG: OsmC family peroxiredoxin, partial [Burkholderiales bacterium]|nr:OsmC family peroxiredoxin [Burkholderiales bacterium]
LFALRKFGHEPGTLRARATLHMVRNSQGRLRVGRIEVDLLLGVAAAALPRLDRALAQFEAFCSVTESVRAAFPVEVQVFDGDGQRVR